MDFNYFSLILFFIIIFFIQNKKLSSSKIRCNSLEKVIYRLEDEKNKFIKDSEKLKLKISELIFRGDKLENEIIELNSNISDLSASLSHAAKMQSESDSGNTSLKKVIAELDAEKSKLLYAAARSNISLSDIRTSLDNATKMQLKLDSENNSLKKVISEFEDEREKLLCELNRVNLIAKEFDNIYRKNVELNDYVHSINEKNFTYF